MSTPRFYCPLPLEPGIAVDLPQRTFHHAVRVRRMRVGDVLKLFPGDGREADATITTIRRDAAQVRVDAIAAIDRESPLSITLLQGISTGDRMDYTLQKSVELGVSAIGPVMAARSQRLADARAEKRIEHWRDIAISACEQSGRNRVPNVADIASLDEALASIDAATRLLLSGSGSRRLRDVDAAPAAAGGVVLLAGPEGGFTVDEEAKAIAAGFTAITLGPRILRTETAAVAALAAIQSRWGDG
jgi:16S rRNA (uracil1498-N3)-methyltransferase